MLRVKGKGRSRISRTQSGTTSTAMRLPGITQNKKDGKWGGMGRLFRNPRIGAKGKGIVSLFWGF